MANPLSNEQEIYERIKKENITVHPLVWELLDHHIRNDLHIINIIIGSSVLFNQSVSVPDAKKVIDHTGQIKKFLDSIGNYINLFNLKIG